MTIAAQPLPWHADRTAFGALVEQLVPADALIVFAEDRDRPQWFQHRAAEGELLGYMPTDFYLSHRKGWSISSPYTSPEFVETLRQRGASYYAIWCCDWGEMSVAAHYPSLTAYLACAHTPLSVAETRVIYALGEPRRRQDGSSCLETQAG